MTQTYKAVITKKLENGQILASETNTTAQGSRYQFVSRSGAVGFQEHCLALESYKRHLGLDTIGLEWVTAPLDSFSYIHLLVPARAKTHRAKATPELVKSL